jgi:hypothetical protein
VPPRYPVRGPAATWNGLKSFACRDAA